MAGTNSDRAATNGVLAALLLLVAYILSPPLVAFVFMSLGVNEDTIGPVMGVFYAPLVLLYNNFPPYRALMDFCFRALGVN